MILKKGVRNEKTITLISIIIFIKKGYVDTSSAINDTESKLLVLLNEDAAAGVDGFDSCGDMKFDYDTGLETDGLAGGFIDTLSFG